MNAKMTVSRRTETDPATGWRNIYEREAGEGEWMLVASESPACAEREDAAKRIAELEAERDAWLARTEEIGKELDEALAEVERLRDAIAIANGELSAALEPREGESDGN